MALAEEKVSPIDSCVSAAQKFEAESDVYNAALAYSDAIKYARKERDKSRLPELLLSYSQTLNYMGDYSNALNNLEEAEA
ncbi:MAG: hypothetical protein IK025_02030, partial [Bacteroidales bacterium]|nr:hypothetical protein [Bacteroidales bacterium]